MYKDKDVLEGACAIRPYLTKLLETAKANQIDEKLAELLDKSQTGQKVDNRILKLVANQEATRTWMAAFLEHNVPPEVARFYSPLPGQVSTVSGVARYVCPQGDYVWYRRSVGEPIPLCPTHQLELIPGNLT